MMTKTYALPDNTDSKPAQTACDSPPPDYSLPFHYSSSLTAPANSDNGNAAKQTAHLNKVKMKKAIKYIHCRLTQNLSLDEVAKYTELSPCYFSRLFKQQHGIGFNLYVNRQRMKQAQLLLDMPELSITAVAKNLGFSQTSYFCRLFKQTYQVTPQTYRHLRQRDMLTTK